MELRIGFVLTLLVCINFTDLETSSLEDQSQRDQLLNFIPGCSV